MKSTTLFQITSKNWNKFKKSWSSHTRSFCDQVFPASDWIEDVFLCLPVPPICLPLLTLQTAGSMSSSAPSIPSTYILHISLQTLQRLCLQNADLFYRNACVRSSSLHSRHCSTKSKLWNCFTKQYFDFSSQDHPQPLSSKTEKKLQPCSHMGQHLWLPKQPNKERL